MGSTTFEMIQALGPWPYAEKPTFIFTNRSLKANSANIYSVSGDPSQVVFCLLLLLVTTVSIN